MNTEIIKELEAKKLKLEEQIEKAALEYQIAIEDGDGLHDNPHQQAAKDKIQSLESKMATLNRILDTSVATQPLDFVQVGDRLIMQNGDRNRLVDLVQAEEAEFLENAVSIDSPVGKKTVRS